MWKTLKSFIMEEVAVRRDCRAAPSASSLCDTLDTNSFPIGLQSWMKAGDEVCQGWHLPWSQTKWNWAFLFLWQPNSLLACNKRGYSRLFLPKWHSCCTSWSTRLPLNTESQILASHVLSSQREKAGWERGLILGLEFPYTNLQSCFFSLEHSAWPGLFVSFPNERHLAVRCWPPSWGAIPALKKKWIGNSCYCGPIPAGREVLQHLWLPEQSFPTWLFSIPPVRHPCRPSP